MPQNPFPTLKIDYWYKLLPILGAIGLILSLTVNVKVADNLTVLLVSVGIICVGIGEWINHPLQTQVGVGFKITSYNRKNKLSGNLWDLLGLVVMVYAIWAYSH